MDKDSMFIPYAWLAMMTIDEDDTVEPGSMIMSEYPASCVVRVVGYSWLVVSNAETTNVSTVGEDDVYTDIHGDCWDGLRSRHILAVDVGMCLS